MYLKLKDMFSLMLVSKVFNEIVINNRRFQKHLKLSNAIISCDFVHEIYSCYMEQISFDEVLMYVKFEFKKLRRIICSSYVLVHLLCCSRSYASIEVPCRFCSCLRVRKVFL